ncbi:MAG: LIC_13387 family protein [Acidobacteriota bacterium]
MKSVLPLRIAAILTLIHAVLHTVGGVFGKVPPGPATAAADAMKTHSFVALGATRTFWEFYRGMGLGVSIFLFIGSIVFWQLASIAKTSAWQLRPIFVTFLFAWLAMAVNSYLYFFMAPVVTEILIALCFVWAVVAVKPPTAG